MSITESPKWGQPRIAEGTFVIFSFDPVAYATACDPNDEILVAAASRIQRKEYLGLIEGVGMIDLPGLRQNPDIRVVGRAPPQKGEDEVYYTGPKRCVPVHPCADHPEGRAPLVPSAPLPWSDCYVHTLQLVNAFISRVHHSNPTNAKLSDDELSRLSDLIVDDQCGAAADGRAAQAGDDSEGESASESSDYSDEEDGSDSESSCLDVPFAAPTKVYIEIWEDLTNATTLGEPKDVSVDINEIVEIAEEWAARKNRERRTTHTSKWAAEVGQFKPDEPTEAVGSPNADAPIPEVRDYDLGPEDAVDERREHAAPRDHTAGEIDAFEPHPAVSVPAFHTADKIPDAAQPQEDLRAESKGPLRLMAERAGSLRNWIHHILCL